MGTIIKTTEETIMTNRVISLLEIELGLYGLGGEVGSRALDGRLSTELNVRGLYVE